MTMTEAEPASSGDGVRLRDEEAEQILRAAGDPNLPDDVFDVIEQILANHVRSAESTRERAMRSRAEWRRRAKEAIKGRDRAILSRLATRDAMRRQIQARKKAERERDDAKAAAVREFANWVATQRAYNGSEHEHGQSLYNECINAVLPTWADEWAAEQAANAERPTGFNRYCAECQRWTDHEGPHHPFTAGASDETVLAIAREASVRWRETLDLLADAEKAERDSGNRLREEEYEALADALGEFATNSPEAHPGVPPMGNLLTAVVPVVERILADRMAAAEQEHECDLNTANLAVEVAEQQRDFATATAADAVAKLARLHDLLAEPAESRAALLAQRMIRDALAGKR